MTTPALTNPPICNYGYVETMSFMASDFILQTAQHVLASEGVRPITPEQMAIISPLVATMILDVTFATATKIRDGRDFTPFVAELQRRKLAMHTNKTKPQTPNPTEQ